MVGDLSTAIKEFSKSSVQKDPPDPFTDFSSFLDDPFPDFDSIPDWILEPDFILMSADQTLLVEEISVPQDVIEMLNEETHGGVGVEKEGTGAGVVGCQVVLEFGDKTEVLGVSIEEEMEKVSLAGACNGTFVSLVPMLEEVGELDESSEIPVISVSEHQSETSFVIAEEKTEEHIGDEINDENGKLVVSIGDIDSGAPASESDDGSSSSSSEEEDSDDDDLRLVDKVIEVEEGEITDQDKAETVFNSDDEEETVSKGPIKSSNELEILPPVPSVNVSLGPHHQMQLVGHILSMIGTKVIVEGLEKHTPLNEGSILWITESRSPLGLIDEIFGPVKNPYYVVRYNTEEEVPSGIILGNAISFVAEFANHVINDKNLYQKGYDASGDNDEEVSDEAEFSDDEKEAEYKRMQRTTKRGKDDKRRGNQEFVGSKRVQVKGGYQKDFQGKDDKRRGNQEFVGSKRAQVKGGSQKDFQAVATPAPLTVNAVQPEMVGLGTPCGPGQLQRPPVSASFGCGSCSCSHAGQPVVQPQALFQPGGMWLHGMPAMQHPMGPPNNGLQMGHMPFPQQHDYLHHHQNQQQQQQQHPFTGFPNGIPFQQHPNQCGMPHFGQVNLSQQPPSLIWPRPMGPGHVNQEPFGPGPMGPGHVNQEPFGPGPMGPGHVNQEPFGSGFHGQLQPPVAQGGFSVPPQFNPGNVSGRGRKPFQRGRGGHPFGRRGRQ